MAALLRVIYTAPTEEAARAALTAFSDQWGEQYPAIAPAWHRDWERLIPFFDYPPAIRKVVYTTNAIESLNYSLLKVLKGRGAFPHDDAIRKLLYLGLRNASKKWTMPIRDGKAYPVTNILSGILTPLPLSPETAGDISFNNNRLAIWSNTCLTLTLNYFLCAHV